jgi:hypothetical protein
MQVQGSYLLKLIENEGLNQCSRESEIVAFLTPIFDRIFEDPAVVHSEEYTWLEMSSATNKDNQMPDMLVCHGGIYRKR